MSMVVKNNLSAINTLNVMNKNNNALSKSLEKVSSGMKINSAADDPSGYAISERMRVQIRALDQANQNTQNGNKLLKTAEGAVGSTVEILKTLKEKAIDAANGTNTDSDLETIQQLVNQYVDQINDNANVTYNGKTLIDGSMNKAISNATTAVFTNDKLSTKTTGTSQLTDLADRNGQSLGILGQDTIKVSFMQNGQSFTTEFKVEENGTIKTFSDIFSRATKAAQQTSKSIVGFSDNIQTGSFIGIDSSGVSLYTATGESAISISSGGAGVTSMIAGFSIAVLDSNGSVKKTATDKLDSFSEKIRAEEHSENNSLVLQTGVKSNQSMRVALTDMRAKALGLEGTNPATGLAQSINITTADNANLAINVFDTALQKALNEQTKIGAVESRLEYTSENLTTSSENVTGAESTIRDANMAKEMTEFTKNNILMQASQAMLSQANQSTQSILSLLQ